MCTGLESAQTAGFVCQRPKHERWVQRHGVERIRSDANSSAFWAASRYYGNAGGELSKCESEFVDVHSVCGGLVVRGPQAGWRLHLSFH